MLGEVGGRDDLNDGFSFDRPDATGDPVKAPTRIADAFSAPRADEGGEPRATTPVLAGPGPEPVVTEALVEEVTARVLDRLRSKSGEDLEAIVSRLVSDVAERLVRDEIQRIRTGRK